MPYDNDTPVKRAPGSGVRLEAGLVRLFSFARQRRYTVIVFWIVAAMLATWAAATRLTVETDSSEMIASSAPFRQAAAVFDDAFPSLDDRMVLLVEADSPDAVQSVTMALADRLEGAPGIQSVFAPSASPFFLDHGLYYRSVSDLETLLADLNDAAPLIERLGPDPDLAALFDALTEAAAFADPGTEQGETVDTLFAQIAATMAAVSAGDAAPLSWQALFREGLEPPYRDVLTVTPALDYSRLKPAAEGIATARRVAEEVIDDLGLEASVGLTGDPVLRAEELESVSRGIGLAFLVSGVAVLLLLILALRSTTLAFAAFAAVLISIVVTAGLAAITVAPLNLVSIAFTVLLVGLGVDFAVHFLLHVRAASSAGAGPMAAFYRTARVAGAGLMLTAPTTALAFLAFSPTDFVGMRQLGIVAGGGVMVAFLVAMTLLPALISVRPRRSRAFTVKPARPRGRTLARLGGYAVLGLCVPAALLVPRAQFDADPMSLRDAQSPSVVTFQALFEDEAMVPLRLDALAPGEETAVVLAERVAALPEVRQTRTIADFVPEDQDVKADLLDFSTIGIAAALEAPSPDPRPAATTLPALRDALAGRPGPGAAALRTALEERFPPTTPADAAPADTAALDRALLRFWPAQHRTLSRQLATAPVAREDIPGEITERYVARDGRWRVEILPAADLREPAARKAFVEAVTAIAPTAAGGARSTLEAGEVVQTAITIATVLALTLVTILLYVVLRDAVIIVMLLIPLGMAAILTTATGVLFDVPYNYANVIVLPLILGIGIDSGIHLALKARRQYPETAAVHAVTRRAVLFSALTTIASFGSLSFSPHDGTASMGVLLMVGIAWTLATTLLFLPILAGWLHRNGSGSRLPRGGDGAYFKERSSRKETA